MSSFRRFMAGVAAAVIAVLATAAPASAHDDLLSSAPAAGERLDVPPTAVSLEFTAEVMTLGALIRIVDRGGAGWTAGDPVVQAATVTVPVRGDMPSGGYEVRWRVVSSDGHPISGVIPFTVGDAEPLPRATDASATAPRDEPHEQSQSEPGDGGIPRLVLVGTTGAAIAAALVTGFLLLRRRRTRRGADDAGR